MIMTLEEIKESSAFMVAIPVQTGNGDWEYISFDKDVFIDSMRNSNLQIKVESLPIRTTIWVVGFDQTGE